MQSDDWTRAYSGAKVLVLGASGFLGRWTVRRLVEVGAQVTAAVRSRRSGEPLAQEYSDRIEIVGADLERPGAAQKLVRAVRPAVVMNLAGYGVDRSERDRDKFERLNRDLAAELVEAVRGIEAPPWSGARIVHVGSIAEYGPIGGDLREESQARPTTLYGVTKLAGTELLAVGCERYGIAGITARVSTVYGPDEHPGRLFSSIVDAARTGADVELSSGEQRRDFVYAEDVADGLCRLGAVSAPPGWIVNLAAGKSATVREFALTAAKLLEVSPERLLFGMKERRRQEESEHLPIWIERLRKLTGWSPESNLKVGLSRAIQFLRARGEL